MSAGVFVGERFSRRHRFNEMDARAFAALAGDSNPLHHDVDVAGRSRYGALIVSGTHTTALLLGLAGAHFSRNFSVVGRSFTVDFLRPVFMDAHVQLAWEVVAVTTTRDEVWRVGLRGGVYDEHGAACVEATGSVRLSVPT